MQWAVLEEVFMVELALSTTQTEILLDSDMTGVFIAVYFFYANCFICWISKHLFGR